MPSRTANTVTMEDYAADVRLWAATIREKTGRLCLGARHSEGGLVTLLAAQRPENICGLLLVSAPGRKAGDVLREQLAANPANAPIREQAGSIIGRLERGEKVTADGIHPALRPLFQPEVQGFLISLFALDPTKLIAAYDGPVLIFRAFATFRSVAQTRSGYIRLGQIPRSSCCQIPIMSSKR